MEKGDFSFVYVLGSTQDDMNYMTESTDPTDLIHVMEAVSYTHLVYFDDFSRCRTLGITF